MPSKLAGGLIIIGTLIGYVGVFNSFNSMGELQLVLLWGLVALVGLFNPVTAAIAVSVCGEMAADPVGALLLVGLDVDER